MEDKPIHMTVTANYISNAPDLQIRLILRSLLIDDMYNLSVTEKLEILRSEADRLERSQPPADSQVQA